MPGGIWGRPRDDIFVPCCEEKFNMPRSEFRASALERPRSNVVAEVSNEGRIRWISGRTDRIKMSADALRQSAKDRQTP
jgi:hypothetical protein